MTRHILLILSTIKNLTFLKTIYSLPPKITSTTKHFKFHSKINKSPKSNKTNFRQKKKTENNNKQYLAITQNKI